MPKLATTSMPIKTPALCRVINPGWLSLAMATRGGRFFMAVSMKAGTTELMKFHRLQRRLGESKRMVVGLLELLWQATAKNAPEGDIGRFTDEEIAILCDWESDPATLVDALIETRWLDRSDTHRLVVHDWRHHCPTYVKGGMARHGKSFIHAPKEHAKEAPKETPKEHAKEAPIAPSYLTKPFEEEEGINHAHANHATNGEPKWLTALRTLTAASPPSRDLVERIAASVELGLTPRQSAPPVAARLAKGTIRDPTGYLATVVRSFESKYDPDILTRMITNAD